MPASTLAPIPLTANTALKDSIAWASDLPALPAALLDLLALVGADEVDTDELCARLSVDMALTAKLLRLANSSFYGARGEVRSVDAAIARVGLRMVKAIVAAAAASAAIKPPACPGFDFDAFWRHAVAAATAAQALAFSTGADPAVAFTSGLLYRIGQLVLASQVPAAFAETLAHRAAQGGDSLLIERALLGVDHAVVGARIAAHWRLPPAIVAALGQHEPPLARGQAPTLGQLAAWAAVGVAAASWARTAQDASRQAEAIGSALGG
jgi:HD-like signal output (HDOD) protein